jgi:CHAT domain-containing protein
MFTMPAPKFLPAIGRGRGGLWRLLLVGLVFAFSSAIAKQPSGEQQIKLIGEGRYEELVERFEFLLDQPKAVAADLHGLCFAYHKIKQYRRLTQCLAQLEMRIRQGDREGRLFGAEDLTPYAAILRAESANELGDYPLAIGEAGRALEWYEKEGDAEALVKIDALAAMVVALNKMGERDAAWSYVRSLEKVKVGGLFSNDFKTSKSLALARSYMALGAYAQAYDALKKDYLFEANAFLDRLFSGALLTGNNLWLWQDVPRQYMLGKSLLETGRRAEAAERFKKLLTNPRIRQNGEIYWQLLYDLGRLADADGDLITASDYLRQAIEVIERHRQNIDTEVNKIGFAADRHAVYGALVDVLYRRGDTGAMFQYMERAKARALVDLLAGKWREQPPDKVATAAAERFNAYLRLDEQARMQGNRAGGADPQSLLTQLDASRQSLLRADPMFASLVAVQGIGLAELSARLRPDETLLEYFADGPALYLLAINNDGAAAFKLDGAGLSRQIADFRSAIAQRGAQVERQAQALYDRLLRPARTRLRSHLTIVPHSPLHYLPFAALHDGQTWLLQRHSVRMLPSASVEPLLATIPRGAARNALILANPDTGAAVNDLAFAEQEARGISSNFSSSRLLTRAAASERALRSEGGTYAYVHLATHGKFQSSAPLKSFLLLAGDAEYDGLLTVDEIYELKLNADLVSLSACETGLGRGSAGDDVVGLVRGFFFSGARTLLASYWAVDDAATADIMQKFYAGLNSQNKRDALRGAQLELLERGMAPFYWASFYLTGLAD